MTWYNGDHFRMSLVQQASWLFFFHLARKLEFYHVEMEVDLLYLISINIWGEYHSGSSGFNF